MLLFLEKPRYYVFLTNSLFCLQIACSFNINNISSQFKLTDALMITGVCSKKNIKKDRNPHLHGRSRINPIWYFYKAINVAFLLQS